MIGDKVVICLGASQTAGSMSSSWVGMLKDRYKSDGLDFINAGINGQQAINILRRIPALLAKYPSPAAVTLLASANDVMACLSPELQKYYTWRNSLEEPPSLQSYRSTFVRILDLLTTQSPHTKIALLTLSPLGENLADKNNALVRDFNEALRGLAMQYEQVTLVDLYQAMEDYLAAHGRGPPQPPEPPPGFYDATATDAPAIVAMMHDAGSSNGSSPDKPLHSRLEGIAESESPRPSEGEEAWEDATDDEQQQTTSGEQDGGGGPRRTTSLPAAVASLATSLKSGADRVWQQMPPQVVATTQQAVSMTSSALTQTGAALSRTTSAFGIRRQSSLLRSDSSDQPASNIPAFDVNSAIAKLPLVLFKRTALRYSWAEISRDAHFLLLTDGIHFNDTAGAMLADLLSPLLQPLAERDP